MSDEKSKLYDNTTEKPSIEKSPPQEPAVAPAFTATPAEQKARKEAEVYFKRAEDCLKSSSGFFGLFSSGPNYYDATESYQRAGNLLKEAKLCKKLI